MKVPRDASPGRHLVLMVASLLMLPLPLFLGWPVAVFAEQFGGKVDALSAPVPGLLLSLLALRRWGVLAIPFTTGSLVTAAYFWLILTQPLMQN